MSKTIGYVLLLGLLGAAIFSIGLLMWIWIRSSNPNDSGKDATPTPRTGLVRSFEPATVALIDVRQTTNYRDLYSEIFASGKVVEVAQTQPNNKLEEFSLACG